MPITKLSPNQVRPLHHLSGNAAPSVNNDTTQGYEPGSLWHALDRVWYCTDAPAGNAVWKQLARMEDIAASGIDFNALTTAEKTALTAAISGQNTFIENTGTNTVMDNTYTPTTDKSIATKEYVDDTTQTIVEVKGADFSVSADGTPRLYRVTGGQTVITVPNNIPAGAEFTVLAMAHDCEIIFPGRVLGHVHRSAPVSENYVLSHREAITIAVGGLGTLYVKNNTRPKKRTIYTAANWAGNQRNDELHVESINVTGLTHTLPSAPFMNDSITFYGRQACNVQVDSTTSQQIQNNVTGSLSTTIPLPRRHGITLTYNDTSGVWSVTNQFYKAESGTNWREHADGTVSMESQGGLAFANSETTIMLPTALANTGYVITADLRGNNTNNANNIPLQLSIANWTTTSFTVYNSAAVDRGFTWSLTGGRLPN